MVEQGSTRVALLYGGTWDERDISIASAREVAEALRGDGLQVTPVRWDGPGWAVLGDDEGDLEAPAPHHSPPEALRELQAGGLGVLFNSLHGGPGEDGTLQGFLETVGIPYTGAGVLGSAVSLNKEIFRRLVSNLGLEVAPGGVVPREAWERDPDGVLAKVSVDIGLPAMVKPIASGSSYGVVRVEDSQALGEALETRFQRQRRVLVERFINGREISMPCLGIRVGERPQILPVVEIEPLGGKEFFDVEAKYEQGKARETVPADIDAELLRHLQGMVFRIHLELDLGGVSRTDLILGADGPVILESQTVPGFTAESLLPKSAAAAGIGFAALCRRLIDYALSAYLARGAVALSEKEEGDV
ncbi:MAG: D-alanine--D-alanine ligase [Planctomycetota bacterium]